MVSAYQPPGKTARRSSRRAHICFCSTSVPERPSQSFGCPGGTYPLSLSHTHTRSLTHTYTHAHAHIHTTTHYTHTHTHTHIHTHTHTHTHTLTHSLTYTHAASWYWAARGHCAAKFRVLNDIVCHSCVKPLLSMRKLALQTVRHIQTTDFNPASVFGPNVY